MSDIQPLPNTFPIVTVEGRPGFYTTAFKRFLDLLINRVGGIAGGVYTQLTYSSSIAWDLDQSPTAVIVLTGNATVTAVNQVAGTLTLYRLTLVQDDTGGRTVSWGSMFKFPSGTAPTLSTGANAVDELLFDSDGTNLKYLAGSKDIR